MRGLALAFILLAAPVSALPITAGTWAPTPLPTLETSKSEDCATCAVLWLLPPGTELLAGGFGYADWPGGVAISRQTDYADGVLAWDGMSFAYDNGHGFASSSCGGQHQRLFRLVAPSLVTYWLAVEDLPAPPVPDWNDYVVRWTEAVAPDAPPPSVPEPSTWALLAMGLVVMGLWASRRRPRA